MVNSDNSIQNQHQIYIYCTWMYNCIWTYMNIFYYPIWNIYIYIYIYKCYHENNVPSRLTPQWFCGNSCTWAHDVRFMMCPCAWVATKPLWWQPGGHIVLMITYILRSSSFCEIWALCVLSITYDHLYVYIYELCVFCYCNIIATHTYDGHTGFTFTWSFPAGSTSWNDLHNSEHDPSY